MTEENKSAWHAGRAFWAEPGRKALLAELWNSGMTVTDIAEHMGITRAMVTGQRERMQLPSRGSPIIRGTSAAPAAPSGPERFTRGKRSLPAFSWETEPTDA